MHEQGLEYISIGQNLARLEEELMTVNKELSANSMLDGVRSNLSKLIQQLSETELTLKTAGKKLVDVTEKLQVSEDKAKQTLEDSGISKKDFYGSVDSLDQQNTTSGSVNGGSTPRAQQATAQSGPAVHDSTPRAQQVSAQGVAAVLETTSAGSEIGAEMAGSPDAKIKLGDLDKGVFAAVLAGAVATGALGGAVGAAVGKNKGKAQDNIQDKAPVRSREKIEQVETQVRNRDDLLVEVIDID